MICILFTHALCKHLQHCCLVCMKYVHGNAMWSIDALNLSKRTSAGELAGTTGSHSKDGYGMVK